MLYKYFSHALLVKRRSFFGHCIFIFLTEKGVILIHAKLHEDVEQVQ
jgi:hypothetical protein